MEAGQLDDRLQPTADKRRRPIAESGWRKFLSASAWTIANGEARQARNAEAQAVQAGDALVRRRRGAAAQTSVGAAAWYQDLKWDRIARLDADAWILDVAELVAWLEGTMHHAGRHVEAGPWFAAGDDREDRLTIALASRQA